MRKSILILALATLLTSCKKGETIYGSPTATPQAKTITYSWNPVLEYVYILVKPRASAQWQWRTVYDGAPTKNRIAVENLATGDSVIFRGIMMAGDTVYLKAEPSYTAATTDTITNLDFTKSISVQ